MRARAPASSANLGPGFDTLAVALACYVEVSVEPAERMSVRSSGEGSELPADATHLAARVASAVAGHDRLAVEVHSDIPVGRGLGSSAALAVAAAAAAGAQDPFALAAEADGHPENAAASALGGLVAATVVSGRPVARRLCIDPEIRFVLLVPRRTLPTTESRRVLPATVDRADAVLNLGRLGILLAGLADHTGLVPEAGDDRLHQDARAALFPEAPALLAGLRQAGALTSCWSGAGPSLLAVTTARKAMSLAAAGARLLGDVGLPGRVLVLEADLEGVKVLPGS